MLLIKKIILFFLTFIFSLNVSSGEAEKIYNEGIQYLFGYDVKVNPKKACDLFEQSANTGYVLAQYNLGHCYVKGKGREVDIDKAKYWYLKAIKQNSSKARIALAYLYLFDIGSFNANEVVSLLEDASTDEPQYAYFLLGYVCHKRIKPNCTDKKAVDYYTQAAYSVNLLSTIMLSYIYEYGIYGVIKDQEKAKEWRENFEYGASLLGEEGQTYESGVEYLKERGFID